MQADRRTELPGNSPLKGILVIPPKIPHLPGRHDTLLDVNLALWVFDLIKELIRSNQLERVLIAESGQPNLT